MPEKAHFWKLLRPTRTGGDIKLWTVDLDTDAWTRLLTGGLAEGVIQLTGDPV
ncbi:hypothetical protein G4Y79_09280 [Phototrophicus methaneseepsis]|uniref:Uncharacterized protein n=1 Tax=Phototrophicus methaneseepsis TaxID=2710758 RepID=A0A7S8ED53_9CHLR|nr:hypothetical protein [Phototrophicus methaneseepsis]QPC84548.1 hypothetical protein G4Y79_09280 [Phototrophicus methaneseepsis]